MMADVIAWWSGLYRANDIVQMAAAFGHLAAIAFAARYALAGDAAALRLTSSSRRPAEDLLRITTAHPRVIGGLAVALLTGLAQLAAQLDYLPRSPIFWIKMTMLALLLVNGRMIQLAGRAAAAAAATRETGSTSVAVPSVLRAAAMRSIALWCAILLLGLLLTTVRPSV